MKYDARFHAFLEIATLVEKFIPPGYQFTKEQGDAVHACAKKLAKDLTSGEYVCENSLPATNTTATKTS